MATNKNQHFVPRCHLRPFTLGEGNAAINVYNLDRAKFFPNSPVKNQCSGDYFYGKDERLEDAIRFVEAGYANVLREIRQPQRAVNEGHKVVLRKFWLLQHLRTEAASRRSMEMATQLDAAARVEVMSFKSDIKSAVQLGMRAFADLMRVIDDLKVCVVRNRTKIPFITSDDPAVLTNRWHLEDKRTKGRSFGLQSSGLLAILPLTPKLIFVAYDGDVYSIPHDQGFADARREEDVRAFNQHQILNCFANLYLHDLVNASELQSQVGAAISRRLRSRHRVNIAIEDLKEGEYTRYRVVSPEEAEASGKDALLHSETIHSRPTTWPSIFRWRAPGTVYTNGTGIGYVRSSHTSSTERGRDFWKEPVR